ncbi:farnesol dehydrogenase-like [Athalia rosae]|uniref:farnesol dehydrogenase-like n=1 Tax=Athalia rosae TaxID=37344 RepID=UPI002034520F|nr:farnesol dehydrogenase-like [Athalia rosae]
MERWVGKVALVTGASSGIGAAITENLVRDGLQVVGVARRVEKVEEINKKLEGFKGKLHVRKCDVTKEEDILEVFRWIKENLGGVDVLVNNAGLFVAGSLTDGETEGFKRILDVNVLAVAIATREAVRSMKEREVAGHIFNINSVLGHFIGPPNNIVSLYPSSKFAVTAMTEVTRKELVLAGTKIKITSVSPGYVSTELFSPNGVSVISPDRLKTLSALNPEDVANAVSYALSTPEHVQVCELIIRAVGGLD